MNILQWTQTYPWRTELSRSCTLLWDTPQLHPDEWGLLETPPGSFLDTHLPECGHNSWTPCHSGDYSRKIEINGSCCTISWFEFLKESSNNLSYQEEIDVIVVVWVVCVVHAEGSVNMADVMDVIKLLEGLIGEVSWTMETLPQVGTWRENIGGVSCNKYIFSLEKYIICNLNNSTIQSII